jgi:predicted nucleotidyltransferase
MKTIVKMIFGSHLYGTNTSDSDKDLKGIFLPNIEDIFLLNVPKCISENTKNNNNLKNTKDDIDLEMYSLHYFLNLACEGETVALDMLHAPDNMILENSDIWNRIRKEKYRFYTKNLKAFVGYAKKQAAKYGIKGSRLAEAKKALSALDWLISGGFHNSQEKEKINKFFNILPEGEYLKKFYDEQSKLNVYEVCGRKIQETVSVSYAYNIVKRFCDNYGERAKQAELNEGIDWKAISHALRAAFQVKQIFIENNITFPLKEVEYLKKVKSGQLHYAKEVRPFLEELMEEVEELSLKSNLPEKCNRKYWNDFIINIYKEML